MGKTTWDTNKVSKYIKENEQGYSLIGDYVNSTTKITIQCSQGHTYSTEFRVFRRGFRCPFCSGKNKKTPEEVQEIIDNIGYKWSNNGEYKNNKSKLSVECDVGHTFSMRLNNLIDGQRCPKCSHNPKWEIEEIEATALSHDCKLVNINRKSKMITLKCVNDDHPVFDVSYHNFKNGSILCPVCSLKGSVNYEQAKYIIEDMGYTLLSSSLKNTSSKIILGCKNGHEFESTMNRVKLNQGCPHCVRLPYSQVKREIEQETDYSLVSEEYQNVYSHLAIKCNNGHTYNASLTTFRSGCRCPYCKGSSGEKTIAKVLEQIGIKFKREKTFNDCRWINGKKLRYDFYIHSQNLLIEFDGEQHYKEVDFYKITLEETQARDAYKNEYANKKGIRLLRIPYWEFDNIEKILKETLASRMETSTTISEESRV